MDYNINEVDLMATVNGNHAKAKQREQMANLIANSTGDGKEIKANWGIKSINMKQRIAIIVALVAIIVSTIGYGINQHNEKQMLEEALSGYGPIAVTEIINESVRTVRQPGTNSVAKFYETDAIAEYLAHSGPNFHIEYFKTYMNLRSHKLGDDALRNVLDEILAKVARISTSTEGLTPIVYNGNNGYLISCGFVDKDGNPDFSKYREDMGEHLVGLYNAQQNVEDPNMGGR